VFTQRFRTFRLRWSGINPGPAPLSDCGHNNRLVYVEASSAWCATLSKRSVRSPVQNYCVAIGIQHLGSATAPVVDRFPDYLRPLAPNLRTGRVDVFDSESNTAADNCIRQFRAAMECNSDIAAVEFGPLPFLVVSLISAPIIERSPLCGV